VSMKWSPPSLTIMHFKRKLKRHLKKKFRLRKHVKKIISKGDKNMSDLQKYISNRRAKDSEFDENYDKGYQSFKIGALLRQVREASGLTQEEIAERLNTKKSAISRIENHAEDIKLSTLEKFASVLGRKIEISITTNS